MCAQKASCVPGCIKTSMASRLRETNSAPLLCSSLLRPHLEILELWGLQHRKDIELLVQLQRATKMVTGLEHNCCGDKLRDLGLLSSEKWKVWGILVPLPIPKRAQRELEREFWEGIFNGVIEKG